MIILYHDICDHYKNLCIYKKVYINCVCVIGLIKKVEKWKNRKKAGNVCMSVHV